MTFKMSIFSRFLAFFLIFSQKVEEIHKNAYSLTKTKSAYLADLTFRYFGIDKQGDLCIEILDAPDL